MKAAVASSRHFTELGSDCIEQSAHLVAHMIDAFVTNDHTRWRFAFNVRNHSEFERCAGMTVQMSTRREVYKLTNSQVFDCGGLGMHVNRP